MCKARFKAILLTLIGYGMIVPSCHWSFSFFGLAWDPSIAAVLIALSVTYVWWPNLNSSESFDAASRRQFLNQRQIDYAWRLIHNQLLLHSFLLIGEVYLIILTTGLGVWLADWIGSIKEALLR